jgi:mannose-6-phosphate isomerase-like protein (cupin superfamily)
MLTPQETKWEDCSGVIPHGAQCITIEGDRSAPNVLFTYRLKMPNNYKIPPHSHPADEHFTVITGTLNIGFGDKLDMNVTKPMPAGSFIVVPKKMHHFVWTQAETRRPPP